jgi:cytochrome b6-f complex iron-sulfur subunit
VKLLGRGGSHDFPNSHEFGYPVHYFLGIAAMADREKMSVQEMLAAARASAGGGASAPKAPAKPSKPAEKEAPPPKAETLADQAEAEAAPAEKPAKPATAKSGKGLSVAEMLAAARSEKSVGGAAPKATKAAGEKPAVEKSAEKPAKPQAAKVKETPKTPAAEGKSAPETQSILAAARKAAKSGPMSKAEAAEKEDVAKPAAKSKATVAPPMPERPAYVRTAPAVARREDEETRRGFFGTFLGSYLAVGFTSLGLTNLLWTLGFARFMFPNILTEPPTRFKVGPPDNFAPGAVETKFVAQFGVWVVNTLYSGQQIIFALKTVCTHLGCTPNWLDAEQKFKCPCHGSGFYKDGINFEGPAPRPLERYAIRRAEDGQLEVDKSKIFQEEKGQWTDTSSFVPV